MCCAGSAPTNSRHFFLYCLHGIRLQHAGIQSNAIVILQEFGVAPWGRKFSKEFRKVRKVAEQMLPEFSIFVLKSVLDLNPKFSRIFRASFPGKSKAPPKIHQKSLPFFNAKSPGKSIEKIPIFRENKGGEKLRGGENIP